MKKTSIALLLGLGAASLATAKQGFINQTFNANISEAEVVQAQKRWGEALVAIATACDKEGRAKAQAIAKDVIANAYDYQRGVVLFKPTLAYGDRSFRTSAEGALSYFVGGNPKFPEDKGFACKHWRSYEIRNAGILINGESAITQGHVLLTNDKGETTMVDKTWGFRKGDDGKVRINLHHSSLPFNPDAKK